MFENGCGRTGVEFHVAMTGNDASEGTRSEPFRSIRHAADVAQPGDTITVHEGIYRETVVPSRGGASEIERITYQAARGEKVVITGSERVSGWEHMAGPLWKVVIPNEFFGDFNPYKDEIHGDWYNADHPVHTGAVYVDGAWLSEAVNIEQMLAGKAACKFWFAQVSEEATTLWAQFEDMNPNDGDVEINVRKTVFTPGKTGVDYITLRGFLLRNAATNWAPPTAGQIGLVTAYWCKGWIIEDNDIAYSRCSGISLGKYSDEWDNRAESAEGYVGTINRALREGWNKETIGSHIIRNNRIAHCGQTGIVGSLGCSFSTVVGNDIHDIYQDQPFDGAEQAGIKFHGAVDVTILDNHIYHCSVFGIWLDWMGQGAVVGDNLLHDNSVNFFFEMQHGPILVVNNLLLGTQGSINGQGIAFTHNLVQGNIVSERGDLRITPFQHPHSTELAGMYPAEWGDAGDDRIYNNLFVEGADLRSLDGTALPCVAGGNVYAKGARAPKFDSESLVKSDHDCALTIFEKGDGWYLSIIEAPGWRNEARCRVVTTDLLGKASIPNASFENRDGTSIRVTTDYFGGPRDASRPAPGPFESVSEGKRTIKVWPKVSREATSDIYRD